jgi:hypothetical protein
MATKSMLTAEAVRGMGKGAGRGVRNLYRVYLVCRPWEVELGTGYFMWQRERLAAIGRREGFGLEAVVGIFAAISPNNTEDGTYRGTVAILRHGMEARVSTYTRNREKAVRIRNGEHPLDVLRGRKVTSFYHNTVYPENRAVVTVDGHMYNAWRGKRWALTDAAHKMDNKAYDRVERDVKVLAGMLGLAPCQLQSVVWAKWRRVHGILTSDQLVLTGWEDMMLPENRL